MHESTVSRATAHKFMLTPRGLREVKFFFTPAIPGREDSESHAAEAVRAR
ncbi:MAG: RNA polymerase factor sigma-54, partial [Burkholderiales bacterium]